MAATARRLRSGRGNMTAAQWRRLGGFSAVIVALHVVGWGVLALFVAPRYAALGLGTGLTAYTFGLRHAFDADHVSAIDNTTRKLMADGKRPLGVGFFFSLGHSTVVFGLAVGLAFAARALAGQVSDSSQLKNIGGYIGTGISATFLYLIALLNLAILVGILRTFRGMRQGRFDEAQLEHDLEQRGLMNRFLGPLGRSIRSSWQMYPLGLLFGLGFDTATEVGLLALAAGTATVGLPWYAILCLPVLFAAGMCLMDTADGAFMSHAYGWAFAKPVRKIYYNITVTGLSVAVAFIVGSVELLTVLSQYFGLSGGLWDTISGISLNSVGVGIVILFIATWTIALAVWRIGRIEERWALAPSTSSNAPPSPRSD